jgi:hypothetical protein
LDDPSFGNNAEASSSYGYKRPRLTPLSTIARERPFFEDTGPNIPEGTSIVLYDQKFAASQILKHIHGPDVNLSSMFELSQRTSQVSLPTPADVDDGDILASVNNTQNWAATRSTPPSKVGISTPANRKRKWKQKHQLLMTR